MAFYSIRDPAPSDTGVAVDKVIDISIISDGLGIDEASVTISVNGSFAWTGDAQQPGFSVSKIPIPGAFPFTFDGYQYLVTPDSPLPAGTTIPMFLYAEDLDAPFNTLNQSWTFETAVPAPVLSSDVYVMGMTASTNAALWKLSPTTPTWTVTKLHENPYSDGSAPRFGNFFMSGNGWIFLTTGWIVGGNGNAFSYMEPGGAWHDFEVVDFPPNLISNPAWNGGGCCIYGIDGNNIWVGGQKVGAGPHGEGDPTLWKWNGSVWTEVWSSSYIPYGSLDRPIAWIIPTVEGGGTDDFYFCEAARSNLMRHVGGVVTVLSDSSVHPDAPNDVAQAFYRVPGDPRLYVSTLSRIFRYDPGSDSWEESPTGLHPLGWPAVDDSGEAHHVTSIGFTNTRIWKSGWGVTGVVAFDPAASAIKETLAQGADGQIIATTAGAVLLYSNPARDNWVETSFVTEFVAEDGNSANGVFVEPAFTPDPPSITPTDPLDGEVGVASDVLLRFSVAAPSTLQEPWRIKLNRGGGWELVFTYSGGLATFEPAFAGPESVVTPTVTGFDVVIDPAIPFLYLQVVRIGLAIKDLSGQPAVVA